MAVAPRVRGAEQGTTDAQLFLSHSSEDARFVRTLAENLNACGVDVWLDAWELRVGSDLRERISAAVANSRYVAVVVSSQFDSSRWMRGEVNQALEREVAEDRVVVLPLLIEEIPPPPTLSTKLYLDFTEENYYSSLTKLVGLIHNLPTASIEEAIELIQPHDVNGSVRALRYLGFEPYYVVDKPVLEEIGRLGGQVDGDRVRFDPVAIRDHPKASPSMSRLMDRLLEAWRS